MLNVEYHGDLQTATFIGTQSAAIQQSWCQLYDAITRKVFSKFQKKKRRVARLHITEGKTRGRVRACLLVDGSSLPLLLQRMTVILTAGSQACNVR